jgi:hypothetical protein
MYINIDTIKELQSQTKHRQYQEIVLKLAQEVLKQKVIREPEITHNLRNTHGTGVDGIEETIATLKENGFFVEKYQELKVPYEGLEMIMYASIKISTAPLAKTIDMGSVTDPCINDPLPSL